MIGDREFKAIAILAFRSAESPTYEDFIRKVQRWYSRNFATPLMQVEEMADEYILKHYFEDSYINLAESQSDEGHKAWIETRGRLIKAFDPPPAEPAPEDMDEDEFWEKALEEEFAKDNPDNLISRKPGGNPAGRPETRRQPDPVYEKDLQEIPQGRVDADGWTHQETTPNLQHQDIHIKADDDIPDDV